MKLTKTERGFCVVDHPDYLPPHEETRLVQESSAIDFTRPGAVDRPGSSCLWIGQRHHLTWDEVAELVAHLQRWVDTGSLSPHPASLDNGGRAVV